MRQILLLLCLFPLFVRAQWDSEEEDLALCHHVNVISGHLSLLCQDAVVRGAQQLPLIRTYTSSGALERSEGEYPLDLRMLRGNSVMQGGWSWFPHITLYVEPGGEGRPSKIYLPEKTGSFICYQHSHLEKDYVIFKPDYKGGQCTGTLTARKNPQNNLLKLDFLNRIATLHLPDGGKRIYKDVLGDDKNRPYCLSLVSEILPSQHQIHYTYNKYGQLQDVLVHNPAGNKTFAAAHFNFIKADDYPWSRSHFHFQTTTSDGSVFDYRSVRYKQRNYLNSVKSNSRPEESVHFLPARKGIGARLHTLALGGNLQLTAHYYEPKNKKEDKRLKWRNIEKRFEIDKVRLLQAPLGHNSELLTLAHFSYNPKFTDVRDTDRVLTRYHHDGERLQQIQYFDEKDQVQSSLKLFWDGSHLKAKALLDSTGQAIYSRTFSYDPAGNVLEETFWGNLTGHAPASSPIDNHGNLLAAESYSKRYEYLPGFNVPTLETEEEGLTYRYSYKPGTDLLTAKLTCNAENILARQFFFYNGDNLLITEILDDGCESSPTSFQGVTERRIKRYERDFQSGLIMATSELCWDPTETKEILIKRSEYSYSTKKQIIAEAVFDSQGTYRYTLHTDYDKWGNVICQTTPLGLKNTYVYNANGHLLESHEAGSLKKLYTCNLSGKPISCSEIDEEGNHHTTYNYYDPKGRLLSQTDTRGNTTLQLYDTFGRCLSTQFPHLENQTSPPLVTYTYDPLGNIASVTTPQAAVVKTRYNALCKPIHVIQADGTELFHSYAKNGLLLETLHPDQTRTTLTYDPFQRMTSKTIYASDGTQLSQERWEYNAFHLLAHTDTRGLTTHYTYDSTGRLSSELCCNRQKLYQYDPLGFLEKTTDGPITYIQICNVQGQVTEQWTEDEAGCCENQMQFFYDQNNRKEKAIRLTSQGNSTDLFSYDNMGRLARHTDPLGAVTQWRYTQEQNSIGQQVLQKTTIDPLGNQTVETYDALNHLSQLEKKSPQGSTLAKDLFYYDNSGNRIQRISTIYQSETPTHTISTTWEYDPMGRVIAQVEADEKTTLHRYDSRGRESERTLPSGIILSYLYDGIDRLLELHSSDKTIHYRYFYENGPDPTTIVDYIHQFRIQRDYNQFGQVTHEINPHGLQHHWTYDHHGRILSLTLPNQSTIAYTYTGAHLTSIAKHGPEGNLSYAHHYTQFDPNGHVQEETLLNNCSITTQRDLMERPIAQSSLHHNLTLAYGPSGLVTKTQNSFHGEKDYAYDPLNQLIKEADQTYSFDSFGNPTNYQINNHNQILATQDTTLRYDPDGNPTQRITPQHTTEYRYDALGRLTTISTEEREVRYSYDPLSRLLSKQTTDGSRTTKILYLYDLENEIGTTTEQGEILQLKILGLGVQGDIGAAVAIELRGTPFAPLHDFNGNIIALLSTQQKIIETYDIDAFGKENPTIFPSDFSPRTVKSTPSRTSNPWRFCSKRSEENLVFFGSRFYDPSLGRWLTPDPAGTIDSPNLYLYVRNSPLNRLDLFGLYSAPIIPKPGLPDEAVNIEFRISKVESFANGEVLLCKGTIGGVEVDWVICCDHAHKLQFSPEEISAGKANLFNHLSELIPNEGALIGLSTLQNGMNTTKKEFKKMVKSFANGFNEKPLIIGLYNPTEGFARDLFRVLQEFVGIETPTVLRTRQMMNAFIDVLPNINPDIIWNHNCHSEAGLIAKNSIEGMTDERREKMRKHVVSVALGPAAPLSRDHVLNAKNFYSDKDRITKRFADRYSNDPNYDIQILNCLTPSKDRKLISGDHEFSKPTYQHGLEKGISDLRWKYGFYETR